MKNTISLFASALLFSVIFSPFVSIADNPEGNSSQTSTCNNLDFEDGNWNNWTGKYGWNTHSCYPLTVTGSTIFDGGLNHPVSYCSFNTLIGPGYGTDPYSSYPGVPPCGGSYAARLGGDRVNLASYACALPGQDGTRASGESIQQTFVVNLTNRFLTYQYAIV